MENKRGWIKILEAFIAVLIISGILLFVTNQGYLNRNRSTEIYDAEVSILREIQLNNTLRQSILNTISLPVESTDGNFPDVVMNKIDKEKPSYLECRAKICESGVLCDLDSPPDEEIYAQSVIITVTLDSPVFSPKRLKLFCWVA
jgi:hypothetical protein